MRHRRRFVHAPPDLTSLFDVLFILVFAALIRTAVVQQAAAQPPPAPPPKPAPPKPAPPEPVKLATAELQAAAISELGKQLASRPYVVVRVSGAGTITALEIDGTETKLDTPLLEHSPDPDIALAYLGDRAAELRVCRVVAVHMGVPDLARFLVIIAPDLPLADLPHALYEGLRRDIDRCLADQRALAVLVDPSLAKAPGGTP